ncbi:MAG: hypothetical protein Q7V58_00645 [Actinomycetota bacterium]|nr:hypothetical protein [Actinomycetota bacterium]
MDGDEAVALPVRAWRSASMVSVHIHKVPEESVAPVAGDPVRQPRVLVEPQPEQHCPWPPLDRLVYRDVASTVHRYPDRGQLIARQAMITSGDKDAAASTALSRIAGAAVPTMKG